MSKGNPKITVRAHPVLLAEVISECQAAARGMTKAPKTVTDFVLAAIREKLAHLKRSRTARANRKAAPVEQPREL